MNVSISHQSTEYVKKKQRNFKIVYNSQYDESLSLCWYCVIQFDVSATDNGVPQLTATANARVTITVIRNTAPFFTNTNTYQRTINKNYPEGTSVFTVTYGDNDQVVSKSFA